MFFCYFHLNSISLLKIHEREEIVEKSKVKKSNKMQMEKREEKEKLITEKMLGLDNYERVKKRRWGDD